MYKPDLSNAYSLMNIQFLRFILVGMLNTLFGYTVFAALLYLGLHYSVAMAIATVLGILFNYTTNSKLVFNYKGYNRIYHYIFVYSVIYCINITGIYVLTSIGASAYLAAAILIIPLVGVTYLLSNKFVFMK